MTRSKKTKPSTSSVGETLVSQYADRLAVRQARDEIDKAAQVKRANKSGDGAQSSPELASLAASYINHEDPNVRSLAAAVLRLVRE